MTIPPYRTLGRTDPTPRRRAAAAPFEPGPFAEFQAESATSPFVWGDRPLAASPG